MKRNLIIFAGLILAAFMFLGAGFAQDLKPAPDFTTESLNKEKLTLSQFKNVKPVLIVFWTTWCPFCRAQLKVLNEKSAQISSDGVELMAINIGESQERVQKFVAANKYSFKVFMDKDSAIAEKYDVIGIPLYKLIDKAGNIIAEDNSLPDYKKLLK